MSEPARSRAESIVRDVRQLLALVGIPEMRTGREGSGEPCGGYSIGIVNEGATLMWWAHNRLDAPSGTLMVDHPDHPLVRVERATTFAMQRALAEVLYAAGFTVVQRPGVPSRNLDNARDPALLVVASPEFKAWLSG